MIFPKWNAELGVPTVGDDVRILCGDVITIDSETKSTLSFNVSVQPCSLDGLLTERGDAIATLLTQTHKQSSIFIDKYLNSDITEASLKENKVILKNILENHRSALEYVAHHIANYCAPIPDESNVQFPVAKPKDDADTFKKKLEIWFPKLNIKKPKVFQFLESIQEFNGELWLKQLSELTNFNKHRIFSSQVLDDFDSVVIKYGDVGIRFGELGLRSLTIEEGGRIRFINKSGQSMELEGECSIDVNTISIPGADPRVEVLHENRRLLKIPGSTMSIPCSLWIIDTNVFRTVNNICALLSE